MNSKDEETQTADVLVLLQDQARLDRIKASKKKYRQSAKGKAAHRRATKKYLEKKKLEELKKLNKLN